MASIGLNPSSYSPAYGGIPNLPSPTTTATTAIGGNVANIPGLNAYLQGLNPNYRTQQGIIGQELQGQVPGQVVGQLKQQAAEQGLATGNENTLSNYLSNFLGTSYGIQQAGMGAASQLMGESAGIVAPYTVTAPAQQQAAETQSIYNAAPVPSEAAKASMDAIQKGYGSIPGFPNVGGPAAPTDTATGPLPWQTSYGVSQPYSGFFPDTGVSSTATTPNPLGMYGVSGLPYNPAAGPGTTTIGGLPGEGGGAGAGAGAANQPFDLNAWLTGNPSAMVGSPMSSQGPGGAPPYSYPGYGAFAGAATPDYSGGGD